MLRTMVREKPAYYISGRQIEPIEVIEDWALCHHLASVVKYIARAGRKESYYQDLRKAEWYLSREIERRKDKFNSCHLSLLASRDLTPKQISDDWTLSPNLAEVLQHIRSYINRRDTTEYLARAYSYLQKETSTLKEVRV